MKKNTELIERILFEYAEPVEFNDGSVGDAINIFHIKSVMSHFVEQACEAVKQRKQDEHDSEDYDRPTRQDIKDAFDYAMNEAQQAIREKFGE